MIPNSGSRGFFQDERDKYRWDDESPQSGRAAEAAVPAPSAAIVPLYSEPLPEAPQKLELDEFLEIQWRLTAYVRNITDYVELLGATNVGLPNSTTAQPTKSFATPAAS